MNQHISGLPQATPGEAGVTIIEVADGTNKKVPVPGTVVLSCTQGEEDLEDWAIESGSLVDFAASDASPSNIVALGLDEGVTVLKMVCIASSVFSDEIDDVEVNLLRLIFFRTGSTFSVLYNLDTGEFTTGSE